MEAHRAIMKPGPPTSLPRRRSSASDRVVEPCCQLATSMALRRSWLLSWSDSASRFWQPQLLYFGPPARDAWSYGGRGMRIALVAALLIGVGSPRFALAQSSSRTSEESWPPLLGVSPVPGSVLVHIESPAPVDLEHETGDRNNPAYVICTSPCDTWVSPGSYRIASDGMRASDHFELLANAERETVVVAPASSAAFGIGIALIVVGGVVAVLGSFVALADFEGSSDTFDLALGLMAGGSAAVAGGIVLVVLNHASRVHQTTAFGPNVFRPSAKSLPALFPSDVEHRGGPIPGYPRATSWPLLRLTF